MTFHHPLAYLLAMEGVALLDAWFDGDRAYVEARIAETRRLLADPALAAHPGVEVGHDATAVAYAQWAASYDDPSNGLFAMDEPVIDEFLAGIPAGRALDAACGTGRLARLLAAQGHDVIGVDASPPMLEVERSELPGASWVAGSLLHLPIPDQSIDVLTCGLALVHVGDLTAAYAEFARVLAPGGHLIISDVHRDLAWLGSVVSLVGADGSAWQAETHLHPVTAHLRAALAAGLQIRACEERPNEIPRHLEVSEPVPLDSDLGTWSQWPWTLTGRVPDATRLAWARPAVVILHFQSGQEGR